MDNRQLVKQRSNEMPHYEASRSILYLGVDALDVQDREERLVWVEPSRYHCLQGARAKRHMEPPSYSVEEAAITTSKAKRRRIHLNVFRTLCVW